MKKYSVLIMTGILSLALVFGLALVGCPLDGDDGDGGDPPGIQPLPESKGDNALSGKTYFEWNEKIEFAAGGKYTVFYGKFENNTITYTQRETGDYAWDADAKTVTTKPEKQAPWDDEKNDYGKLQTLAERKTTEKKEFDALSEEVKEQRLADVKKIGFSSADEYIDDTLNYTFSNTTYVYSFSTDNAKALFLEQQLPENSGTNELAGKTYYGRSNNAKDTTRVYTFAADGTYTFVHTPSSGSGQPAKTGKYSVVSKYKNVYLQPATVNGKTKKAYYADLSTDSGDVKFFTNADEYRAAQTNNQFSVDSSSYDSTEKTISR
jgi:hypothetical protein